MSEAYLVEEMVCPLCLEWGPETESGFCADCKPPVARAIKNHRYKLRLKHCRECGRPFLSRILHNNVRCTTCRDSCKHCGKPVKRSPKAKTAWAAVSCPECISRVRREAVAERHRGHPVPLEFECRTEGCHNRVTRKDSSHTKVKYCDSCRRQANRRKAHTMQRLPDGKFLPKTDPLR